MKIHFDNQPIMVVIDGQRVKAIPVVYDSKMSCGVGLLYKNQADKDGQYWGLLTPRNLITSWRATEVLRYFDAIECTTLCCAYYTGTRNPHQSLIKEIEPIIKKIGQSVYDKIMSMPVPEKIIRAILDNQNDDFAPDLHPIFEEIKAGTIQWRQEFADAGIKHPDQVKDEEVDVKNTIEKFRKELSSYAYWIKVIHDAWRMFSIEDTLVGLVKAGLDQTHSRATVVALAGVLNGLSIKHSDGSYPSGYDKRTIVKNDAYWLSDYSGYNIYPWKKEETSISPREATTLLEKMFEEYISLCNDPETKD